MRTLPTTMVQVLAPFVPLFSERVWAHVRLLLAGAILAPGKRTVASALRAVGCKKRGASAATIGS
jgi:leucyl-tRNA synthetase